MTELYSTKYHSGLDLSDFFKDLRNPREIYVASAYTDIELLNEFVKMAQINCSKRPRPIIKVFLDLGNSGVRGRTDQLKAIVKIDKKITKFARVGSGIFLVQVGKIFHSKFFCARSKNEFVMNIGSLNFTKAAMNLNEEILAFWMGRPDDNTKGWYSFAFLRDRYLPYIEEKSLRPFQIKSLPMGSLRDLLLSGMLCHEYKEPEAFRFRLRLPEEALKSKSELHGLLQGKTQDSISIIDVMGLPVSGGGMGLSIPRTPRTNAQWKKFTIETCYGYWVPAEFYGEIEEIINERKMGRRPRYDAIRNLLEKENTFLDLNESLRRIFEQINKKVEKLLSKNAWEFYKNGEIETSFETWFKRLNMKIRNDEYFDKLLSDLVMAPVPDLWGDSHIAEEFEESFLEYVIYQWQKQSEKSTSRVICQRLGATLNLSPAEMDELDSKNLRDRLERWLKRSRRSPFVET